MKLVLLWFLLCAIASANGRNLGQFLKVLSKRASCDMTDLTQLIQQQSKAITSLKQKVSLLETTCATKHHVKRQEGSKVIKCSATVLDMYKKTNELRKLDIKYIQLEADMNRLKRQVEEEKENLTLTYCDRAITGVAPPTVVHRIFGDQVHYNAWMRDSAVNDGRIWLMRGNTKTFYVAEYASETHLRANITRIVYKLPIACDGTGHVVYKGHLYCNKAGAGNIIKYSFDSRKVVLDKAIGSYYSGTYVYKSGSYTAVDLAVDETGLWVIYANSGAGNSVLVSKLNESTLEFVNTWKTGITKSTIVDAFMRCGVLYTVNTKNTYASQAGCLFYKYDTRTSTRTAECVRIPPFRDLASHSYYHYYMNYNPLDKMIYASTYQHLLSYKLLTY